jgi:hypothetical protein
MTPTIIKKENKEIIYRVVKRKKHIVQFGD